MDAPRYHPAQPAASTTLPLARYLPPLGYGTISGWLAENAAPGSWLLDPLGASPALVLEAARAGYRVLAAANNPIVSFIIEVLALAPKRSEFQSVLAELAAAKRGSGSAGGAGGGNTGERLERYIQNLYLTECDTCGDKVPAQAFLWRKGEKQPFGRLYHCPRCGESGERPITQGDLDRLAAMGGDKLQRARALQRVILNEEEQTPDVEEALENYLARPLYVLFTIMNKIEGLGLPPERLRLLQALMISAFDAGTALWTWPAGKPGGRSRPKQLSIPPQFRELNLWHALEAAVDEWTAEPAPVTITRWPDLPETAEDGQTSGTICLYRGRVKALMPLPEHLQTAAAVTVFPRPNQAFWTLSVLWSGWLWGPEAALPLRSALDRRRYDWNWHTSAVHQALAAVGWHLSPGTPFFGILPEVAPGFLSAVIVAAEAAGLRLDGLAMRADSQGRADQETAQGTWHPLGTAPPSPVEVTNPAETMEKAAREGVRADLQARGEPAPYLTVYAGGLCALACSGAVPHSPNSVPGDLLTRVQAVMARTFADRGLLRLWRMLPENTRPERSSRSETPAEEERGVWGLNLAPEQEQAGVQAGLLPLADRVEMEVVRFMQRRLTAGLQTFSFDELDRAICAQFRGLLTPPVDLVRACLESYGQNIPDGSDIWRLRENDSAAARKGDLKEMRAAIEAVGRRLGYQTVEEEPALVWKSAAGKAEWWFFRMASSILSRYVLAPAPGPLGRCVLVLPGGRARLLSVKLRRDPRTAEAVRSWRFLKFRHLREIAIQKDIGAADWTGLLDEDPLTDDPTQMRLFSR